MAEEFPDETAYTVVDVGALTFSEWDREANALARGLVGSGLRPGDRVGIHLDPSSALRWLVSYTAVHRAGGVAVPMNPRLAPAEVAHVLAHSGAVAVIADHERVAADLGCRRRRSLPGHRRQHRRFDPATRERRGAGGALGRRHRGR